MFEHLVYDDIVMPVNTHVLEELLIQSNYDAQLTDELVRGFRGGFDIGYRGPLERQDLSNNIPITVGSHEEMRNKIMKEVKLG